jgi:hypothetical protein
LAQALNVGLRFAAEPGPPLPRREAVGIDSFAAARGWPTQNLLETHFFKRPSLGYSWIIGRCRLHI